MGIDPAPFWANIYLYDRYDDLLSSIIKTDKPGATKFKNASRFIADECNLDASDKFSKSFHVIYTNQLQLKSKHHGLNM